MGASLGKRASRASKARAYHARLWLAILLLPDVYSVDRHGKEREMTYKGHVENGVVVLDPPGRVPEGAKVEVQLLAEPPSRSTVGQRLMKHAGVAKGLPSDLARNHDHYLHGTPRK
jgi:hypothetical protein